jgi:predicted nuclease of predicted toxin-antitoxin system
MGYRLLLDEHLEQETYDRLEDAGHDVEHVDCVPSLGKGSSDVALARYGESSDRIIVTYDDDFVDLVSNEGSPAVLFFEDDTLSPESIAAVITAMSAVYPHDEVHGLQKTGREWL